MHPVLFQIPLGPSHVALFGRVLWLGALTVPSYGALLGLGLLLGGVITWRSATRAGLQGEGTLAALLVGFFVGLLGARLGYVLLHPGAFDSLSAAVSLRSGGLSGIFGIGAGAAGALMAARRRGVAAWTLFDAAAPAFGLTLLLARLGCFLEGCDFGKPLSASAPRFLARLGTFPAHSHAWATHVQAGLLAPSALTSLPVHPSELYECLVGLALGVLALLLARRAPRAGALTLAVSLGYLALRVLVDFTRPVTAELWCVRVVALLAFGVTVPCVWLRARARHP